MIRKNKISHVENSRIKNEIGIKNHKKVAKHLNSAAKKHIKAAKQHKAGKHKKAARSTIQAHGFVYLANQAQRSDVIQHAVSSHNIITE